MSIQLQVTHLQPAPTPKIAFLTEDNRERNLSRNRRLNPDFLGAEDIDFVVSNSNASSDLYDDDLCDDDKLDALVRLLAMQSVEDICIYCLINDGITGEEIANALHTSREMPRVLAKQIAEKIDRDKDRADAPLFELDDETVDTIKNVIYSSADEKLAYLHATHADEKRSTRGRKKAKKGSPLLLDLGV